MDQKIDMISKYPFHLAIESTNREAGWVTEKIYQALYAGTVPVYYGNSREVAKHLPPGSYIDVGKFSTAKELAEYILEVAFDTELYMSYHAWRWNEHTATYFDRLVRNGRTNSPCRLCEHIVERKKDPGNLAWQGALSYSKEEGWTRSK